MIKKDKSYYTDTVIKSVGLCLGASCPTKFDEVAEEQAEIDIETEIESGINDLLASMGVEGTINCNVDIDLDTPDLAIK